MEHDLRRIELNVEKESAVPKKEYSFISESSLGFALSSRVISALGAKYKNILPIYFYLPQEGSNTSARCNPGISVRIVSVFMRRPKVPFPGSRDITIKFNKVIFDWTKELNAIGIPVLAVAPLASSLFEINKCDLAWFWLGESVESVESKVVVNIDSRSCSEAPAFVKGPMKEQDVLPFLQTSNIYKWPDAIEKLANASRSLNSGRYPMFGGGLYFYRPIFFLHW
jgi:hypothetical protein